MPSHLTITFDVSCRHDEVVSNLELLGYKHAWNNKGIHYTLPHNMLWKKDMAMIQPLADLKTIIERLNRDSAKGIIVLEKSMTLSCEFFWDGLPNTQKTKEERITALQKELNELKGE